MLSGFRQQPDVAHLVLPEHVVGKGPVAVEVPRANTHAEVMPEAECRRRAERASEVGEDTGI
jgi:hypothetical protein